LYPNRKKYLAHRALKLWLSAAGAAKGTAAADTVVLLVAAGSVRLVAAGGALLVAGSALLVADGG